MDITAFLADSAEVVNGKIYALGIGWDLVASPTFPFAFPRVALGILIHVGWTETDEPHELRVRLETEDGDVVPLSGAVPGGASPVLTEWASAFSAGRPPLLTPGDDQIVPMALNINNIVFPRPGGYSWVISLDGEPASRLRLKVVAQGA